MKFEKKKNTYVIVSVIVYTRIALSNYITHLFALLGKKFDEIRRGAGAGDKPFTKTRMVKYYVDFRMLLELELKKKKRKKEKF